MADIGRFSLFPKLESPDRKIVRSMREGDRPAVRIEPIAFSEPTRSALEQRLEQLVAGHLEVRTNLPQDGAQGSNSKRAVPGNGDVVLAFSPSRRQPQVATRLTGNLVPVTNEQARELLAGQVARQSQAAMISSLTTWRRITCGRFGSSK